MGRYGEYPEYVSINVDDNGVWDVSNGEFYSNLTYADVTIPEGVTELRNSEGGYNPCEDLTNCASVTLPNSLIKIGDNFFDGCSMMTGVTMSSGITYIGDYAFSSCSCIEEVELPDSLTHIGDYAFNDCHSLESVTLPSGLTRIEEGAFANCSSLTGITIPDSVSYISPDAFYNCTNLTQIHWNGSVYNYENFNDIPSYTPSGPADC